MNVKDSFGKNFKSQRFYEISTYYVFLSLFMLILLVLHGIFSSKHLYLLMVLPLIASFIILVALIRAKEMGRKTLIFIKVASILSLASGIAFCCATKLSAFNIILVLAFILPVTIIGLLLRYIIQLLIEYHSSESVLKGAPISKITYAKIEYHHGPLNGQCTISPIDIVAEPLISGNDIPTTLTCRLNCKIVRLHEGCGLLLTLKLIIPSSYLGKDIEEELAFRGINIYIDGTYYSSITFYEGSEGAPARPTSVTVMKPAEIRLSILQPLVTGISEGSHMLAAILIDRSGGTLFADVTSFEIFEWMQEGEVWAPVPIKIISHKLDQVMRGLMHYKMEKLDSVQEVTRTASITSSTIEIMEVDSEEYFITAIEFSLSVLDYNNLYSIKIYVDGEEFYKILLMEALHLLKDHRYIVKIPHLPPLTLRKVKHSILLKLLKQDFLSKREQTLSARIIQFTYPPAKKHEVKRRKRRRKLRKKSPKEVIK